MSNNEAEFALRSLAIEALAICSANNLRQANITVLPDCGDEGDFDYWKVQYGSRADGNIITVSCSYEDEDDA